MTRNIINEISSVIIRTGFIRMIRTISSLCIAVPDDLVSVLIKFILNAQNNKLNVLLILLIDVLIFE